MLRNVNDERCRNVLDIAAWLAVVLCLGYYVDVERQRAPAQDCQVYGRFGRGIGCEDEDLGDP